MLQAHETPDNVAGTSSAGTQKGADDERHHKFQKTLSQAAIELTCPLTFALLRDPVTAEDGRLYERGAIQRWLADHDTSPVTRQPMGARLLPAVQVRSLIEHIVQSGALPEDDTAEWHRERAAAEADAAVRRRAEAGSAEDLAELGRWKLFGTHDEPVDVVDWLRLAIRAATPSSSGSLNVRVPLDDARYTAPRARPSLAGRLDGDVDRERGPHEIGPLRFTEVVTQGRLWNVSASMRRILVDWLVDVQREFSLTTYTLYLAVHFLDLYLSDGTDVPVVERGSLQLAGIACMRLAELSNEQGNGSDVHSADVYAEMSASTYTATQVECMQAPTPTPPLDAGPQPQPPPEPLPLRPPDPDPDPKSPLTPP